LVTFSEKRQLKYKKKLKIRYKNRKVDNLKKHLVKKYVIKIEKIKICKCKLLIKERKKVDIKKINRNNSCN